MGRTLPRVEAGATLVVMSDHGFTSWRRAFHLNTWLKEQGYLAVLNPNLQQDPGLYGNVDWSRTRAYGLGLNGLYVNVAGREKDGIVDPSQREALAREIKAKLLEAMDPEDGRARGHARCSASRSTATAAISTSAPTSSWATPRACAGRTSRRSGAVGPEVDHRQHGGVERRPLHGPGHGAGRAVQQPPAEEAGAKLEDLAAAILAEFGVERISGAEARRVVACSDRARIKIDKDLLAKVEKVAKLAGYSSADEFVNHALEKELAKLEGADSEEEIKKRLRGLGYIS